MNTMKILYRFLALCGIAVIIDVLPSTGTIAIHPVLATGIIILASALIPELEKRL